MPKLRINTSLERILGPSRDRSRSRARNTPNITPTSTLSIQSTQRIRSASTSSTSSSLSIVSPAPSASASASSSSVNLLESSIPSVSSYTTVSSRPEPFCEYPATEETATEHVAAPDYVLAMHDFSPQHQNATCLSFRAGQVIHVLNRDQTGWWDGELDGRRGWFPSNYVSADVNSITEELSPLKSKSRPGETHRNSIASVTSWASTPSPRHNTFTRHDHRPHHHQVYGAEPETESYCPPLMVPLLHGLSLLQNAVRANRHAHFQPSTACIISCVRTILDACNCLTRETPALKRFPPLAQARKGLLADLAALVAQSKRATDSEHEPAPTQDAEIEAMLRLGGQVFAHVRRFLALAAQCGIELPQQRSSIDSATGHGQMADDLDEPTAVMGRAVPTTPRKTTNGIVRRPPTRHGPLHGTPSSFARARSMGDLRGGTRPSLEREDVPAMPRLPPAAAQRNYHKARELSISSISSMSSTSSFSSTESADTPDTPPFPTGPSSAAEVLDVLRHTHDAYLSTIAAFVGHAHSHSRGSHASSTGHMYDLAREIVEMVCKLLTIVEAVMRHPDVGGHAFAHLAAAKAGLYAVTSAFAESVRLLTTDLPAGMSEEDEKGALLRSATGALKAGADCVGAVKLCMQRTAGEFVVQLPREGEVDPAGFSPSTFGAGRERLGRASSGGALYALYKAQGVEEGEDEDMTIQAQTPSAIITPNGKAFQRSAPPRLTFAGRQGLLPGATPPMSPNDKPLPPLVVPRPDAAVEQPLPSPSSFAPSFAPSFARSETTWEGSQRDNAMEDKLINGDLPSIPDSAVPRFMGQDPVTWMLSHDYAIEDVAYNTEGLLVGATLSALVEKMTPHDSLVDTMFSSVFFLTFRLFATPQELVQALIARYNIAPPPGLADENVFIWQQRKGVPVRLRVSNFVKAWLEVHWHAPTDCEVLPALGDFTLNALASMFPGPSQRIMELVGQRARENANPVGGVMTSPKGTRRDAGLPASPPFAPPGDVPRPVMTKTLLAALRAKNFAAIAVTDFDTLELARQMAIMECALFCAIEPDDLLEIGKEGAKAPLSVKAVTSLSTVITGWVTEGILNEADTKKRAALVKFFIKLADRCTSLNNFSTSRSILAALDSSTISRLHQTWAAIPSKYKAQLEAMRKLADHSRNYREYRTRLRNTAPPAVPFLGLYLTDITFCREGNPSHRASPMAQDKKLINFNKYHKLARIVQDMQRFQVPYTLKSIPEAQDFLHVILNGSRSTSSDIQDLYRRSLLVEPRQAADTAPSGDLRQLFPWTIRSSSSSATTPA